jgi:hypothetical protein
MGACIIARGGEFWLLWGEKGGGLHRGPLVGPSSRLEFDTMYSYRLRSCLGDDLGGSIEH